MKTMRWFTCCAIAATLAIAGCGKNDSTAEPAGPTPIEQAKTDETTINQQTADGLITQATEYIKTNKMDLADKAISQLEGMKPKLAPEYGGRIDQLRSMYNSAKTAAGQMPGGIKLPG